MAAPRNIKTPKGDFHEDDVTLDENLNGDTEAGDAEFVEEEAEDTPELNFDTDYGRMADLSDDADDWN